MFVNILFSYKYMFLGILSSVIILNCFYSDKKSKLKVEKNAQLCPNFHILTFSHFTFPSTLLQTVIARHKIVRFFRISFFIFFNNLFPFLWTKKLRLQNKIPLFNLEINLTKLFFLHKHIIFLLSSLVISKSKCIFSYITITQAHQQKSEI